MTEDLGLHAAMFLRDATENAIKELEKRIQGEPPGGPNRDYFVNQMKDYRQAIGELQKVRAAAHHRVFAVLTRGSEAA